MKNKLTDLNDHLFAQLERLSDEDLSPEKLAVEIDRTKAITSVAQTVINNAQLCLDAHVAAAEWNIVKALPILGVEDGAVKK